jgi:murein DD-endopeptidase MepM/ murein hydrolase activator NlpD
MTRRPRSAPLTDRILRRLHAGVERGLNRMDRHPRLLSGLVLASLATFGATAFGVAPVSVTTPSQPQSLIVEVLPLSDSIRAQRDSLAKHDTVWHHSTETRVGDTMASVFQRLGILDAVALEFAATDPHARRLLEGRSGKRVHARADERGRLVEMIARLPSRDAAKSGTHFTRLTLRSGPEGIQSGVEAVPFGRGVRMASGAIRSSLFAATDESDVPESVAIQIADIFASDIDFHRELRRGDSFRVVFESLMADDEPATWNGGSGRVLAVEFVNRGRKHEAVWYSRASGRGEYYDFQGQSRRKAFLASPLEFSRVTSGFSMRFHPILKSWRQHLGTDFASPTGTAVRTVGDGTVEFAGVQNGYGNVVIVKHSQARTTLYAHLSRIDVTVGQPLNQGDRLGAVGSTGWSTGPHLHFEFKVGGEHQDPQVLAKASETVPLSPQDKPVFASLTRDVVHQLTVASTLLDGRRRGD